MTTRNWIVFSLLIGACVLILIGLAVATNIDKFENFIGKPKKIAYNAPSFEDKNEIDVERRTEIDYTDTSDDAIESWVNQRDSDAGSLEDAEKEQASRKNSQPRKKSSSKKSTKKSTKKFTRASKGKSGSATKTHVMDHDAAYSYLEQSFDSLGEYVSPKERTYRLQLVDSLDIQTIVIDCLSEKNGISQEFFKIVYLRKMIPAKILINVVESKEFRNLIPSDYLVREKALGKLKNGDFVVFKKSELKRLLDIWCNGQLTPIRKAWSVGAEK